MAKRLGAEQNNNGGTLSVECLKGLYDKQSAEQVAEYFSRVSQRVLTPGLNETACLPACRAGITS